MHTFLQKLGYQTADPSYYTHIQEWLEWYQGKVKSFHSYRQYNGKSFVGRERATLGMAKKVAEDWANLLLNERVEFFASDHELTCRAEEILRENQFRVRGNQLIELAFALGTGAFVEYLDQGRVRIDCIRADMIYPLSWDNGVITECAFASEKVISGQVCVYLQLHVLERGRYVIKNYLFDQRDKRQLQLPAQVRQVFDTGSRRPLFQIIKPNIINNIKPDHPMGISVFANAIDLLKGADLVFDSYQNEFRLGKKRIVVPAGMVQMQSGVNGISPIFDDNDVEFYALSDKSLTDLREINMEIRSNEHKEGLLQILGMLSDKCGLGAEHYRHYRMNSPKTATEVISEKSEMFRNLKKHEILLRAAFCDMLRAVLFLDGAQEDVEIKVDFDDSIIIDRQSEFAERMRLLDAGVISRWELRAWWCNEDEETAKRAVKNQEEDGKRGYKPSVRREGSAICGTDSDAF